MFSYADWQILWFVLMLVLIFYAKDIWRSKLKYLLVIIVLDFILFIYAFSYADIYQFLVDGTLVNRVMMLLAPTTLFFVAATFAGQKQQP